MRELSPDNLRLHAADVHGHLRNGARIVALVTVLEDGESRHTVLTSKAHAVAALVAELGELIRPTVVPSA